MPFELINSCNSNQLLLSIEVKFKYSLQHTVSNGLVVHWDGKLLPDITGHEKVDRLPIVVIQENTEQLIAVPKL